MTVDAGRAAGLPLEFKILGPLEVLGGGVPLELGGPRRRVTLALLLIDANKVVPIERLLDAIYGENWPPTGRSQVQIQISSLRRLFTDAGHDGVILTHAQGYSLQIEPSSLDAHQFAQLAGEARDAPDPEEAVAKYRQAHRLWRGPALQGLTSQIIESAASRLDEAGIDIVEDRIQLELSLGRHSELISELAALAEEYPLRERLCGQLMLALHNCGRTVEALRIYQRSRATLVTELGLEPGEKLQQLHRSILRADPALAPTVPAPLHSAAIRRPVPRLLPIDIGDFTGRTEQLSYLRQCLTAMPDRDGRITSRVTVIAGTSGVGKTATAVRAAHLLSGEFPDGQLFIDLHGSSEDPVDPSEVLERFIRVLGPPPTGIPDGLDERAETYRNLLAGRRILVVLDDAAGESQVAPLLPGDAAGGVLITSRGRLAGVPDTAQLDLGVFDAETSLEMLGRIVGLDRLRGQQRASAEVVERCGHLPLALRIVGARLLARPHWSVQRLADRLSHEALRLDELSYGDLSVRESISPTYEGAGQQEQRLFRRLALLKVPTFAGWVGSALLSEPVGVTERVFDDLTDAHLVEVEDARAGELDRYGLHVLVRDFARERLRADESAPESEAALKRVLGALLCLAEQARLDVYGFERRWEPDPSTWWSLPEQLVEHTVRDPLSWYARERATLASCVSQAADAGFTYLSHRLALTIGALKQALPHTDDMRLLRLAAVAELEHAEADSWNQRV